MKNKQIEIIKAALQPKATADQKKEALQILTIQQLLNTHKKC